MTTDDSEDAMASVARGMYRTSAGPVSSQLGVIASSVHSSRGSHDVRTHRKEDKFLAPELLAEHLTGLPNHVLDMLHIGRDRLQYYARYHVTGEPLAVVNRYVEAYWARRYELQQRGDVEVLGQLHEKIDQIYAQLVGFRPLTPVVVIPLQEFEIESEEDIQALYWHATAGLVMFAEEERQKAAGREEMLRTVTLRWGNWVTDRRNAGPATPEQEALYRFTENILSDWPRFAASWDMVEHHDPTAFLHSGPISKYVGGETPAALHEDASRDFQALYYKWLGDSRVDDLVTDLPAWFKIAYRGILEEQLRAQYGDDVDLHMLDPSVGTLGLGPQ